MSRAGRKPRFDAHRQRLYLAALANAGVISHAMLAAGISSRATIKSARENVPGFLEAEDEALEAAADRLELLADDRARFGHEVTVLDTYGNPQIDAKTGQIKTTFVPPSERLLLARLAAVRPDRYGTHRLKHSGAIRQPTTLILPAPLLQAEFEKVLAAAEASAKEDQRHFMLQLEQGIPSLLNDQQTRSG